MPTLRHYDNLGTARFVTFSCYRRYQLLTDSTVICRFLRGNEERRLFWQPRCYDHNCRGVETVKEKIKYCHKNPVVRGLAESPEEWEWSSYCWYHGIENVPIEMDEFI